MGCWKPRRLHSSTVQSWGKALPVFCRACVATVCAWNEASIASIAPVKSSSCCFCPKIPTKSQENPNRIPTKSYRISKIKIHLQIGWGHHRSQCCRFDPRMELRRGLRSRHSPETELALGIQESSERWGYHPGKKKGWSISIRRWNCGWKIRTC